MTSTVMSLKTDKEIKERAQKLAKQMGFPLGTLINAFLRQFIRDEAIHFSIEPAIPMSKVLEKELGGVEQDLKNKKNLSPALTNSKDIADYLDNAPIE